MPKFIIMISINILLLSVVLVLSDFITYTHEVKIHEKDCTQIPKFSYQTLHPSIYRIDYDNLFKGKSNDENSGRMPDGLFYKGKPILIMGCSFAYGQYLNQNQTFSYKLARQLKRPVYNRAVSGAGLPHMYYQVSNYKSFYRQVPPTDTVIYIMINDHYRRMFGEDFEILDDFLYLHYQKKNNKLVLDNYKNPLLNILRSSYTLKMIRSKYNYNYIHNPKNSDQLTDLALLYFTEIRNSLQNNWHKKINFAVVLYDEINYENILIPKLEQNGFTVVNIEDITNTNLYVPKYTMPDNGHPTESAWNLLTPLIVKSLKENAVI